jgi:glycerophosphoryl diester phosphodiesterase
MPFMRVAHRGFAAVAEENTLVAIEGALRCGCDKIELDVRRSAEGRIVLHHDNGESPSAPLLADALRLIAAAGAGVMLDIKQGGVADGIARLLAEHAPLSRVIASGNSSEVLRLKQLRPAVRAGRTWPHRNANGVPVVAQLVALPRRFALPGHVREIMQGYDVLVAYFRALSAAGVAAAHDAGYEVYAWTVDNPATIRRLESWKVDGIISDHPNSFGLA